MRFKILASVLAVSALGSGCFTPPQAPKSNVAVRGPNTSEGFETYRIPPLDAKTPAPKRNLLLVALDDVIQTNFEPQLEKLYHSKTPVRIEDVAWWVIAPELRGVYANVLRVPPLLFTKPNLQSALSQMEADPNPYDVFLLVHGIPNNLYTAYGNPIVSWKDIDAWKGMFPKMGLLFLQSCYGMTLAPDWEGAGAKTVIGYSGADLDFFYPIALFQDLQKGMAVDAAFAAAKVDVKADIRKSAFARGIISTLGYSSLDDYISALPDPEISTN